MTVLGDNLVLYTLRALKEDEHDEAPEVENKPDTSPSDILQSLPSEPTSIPSFVSGVLNAPSNTPQRYVTHVDWRAAPSSTLYHEYVVLHLSTAPQTPPTAAVRIDRYGSLGVKVPWWYIQPRHLHTNTKRASMTVVAGSTESELANPTKGSHVTRYTHWMQELPDGELALKLRRPLERARNDACTALNHAIRPHISGELYVSKKHAQHGRRWADSRGLQFVHTDVAGLVAEAMDMSILRSGLETLWATILPVRSLFPSARRAVLVREAYSHLVRDYRRQLRRIALSLPDLDSDVRLKILDSWGLEEREIWSPLLIQLLNHSLSRQCFLAPHATMATLGDVVSRLDTVVPLLPPSGPTINMCLIHVQTLMARFPDKLWHAYTTPVPTSPARTINAVWHRAKNSRTFWVSFEIFTQWIVSLTMIPVHYVYELWVFALPIIHMLCALPWILKERKSWRRIWKVYEGAIIQNEDPEWDNDRNAMSSESKLSLLNTGEDRATGRWSFLEILSRSHGKSEYINVFDWAHE